MYRVLLFALLMAALLFCTSSTPDRWGFFGHRRINRLAVFTLPPGMLFFYKKHLEYLTEHAVDPDKRRYATKHEAPRHFIDLDRYGVFPFASLPRQWPEACALLTDIYAVGPGGDSLHLLGPGRVEVSGGRWFPCDSSLLRYWPGEGLDKRAYQRWFNAQVLPQYYEEHKRIGCDSLQALLGTAFPCAEIVAIDTFSLHGILPYHLVSMQNRLTRAFEKGDVPSILRLSAELGHYIGDAHVPLHTTSNYNGQLSGQLGIHAFWESRIPELFADERYDFFTGTAAYISDPTAFYWDIVLESHRLVDSVLSIERNLRGSFPADRQYCYESRNSAGIRTQCPEFAAAYQDGLNGMVERRMRHSVRAIGSAWLSAWTDAGQPDLTRMVFKTGDLAGLKAARALEEAWKKGRGWGRPHE